MGFSNFRKREPFTVHHIMNRIAHRVFFLRDEERNDFIEMMRRVAEFTGIQLLGWCVMNNHFHILAYLPERKEVDEAEVVRRVGVLKGVKGSEALLAKLTELRRQEVVSVAGKMTPKMQKFVDEYLVDLNATQAAIRAGYSKKTAYSIGVSNLKKPEIQAAIQKRQKSAAEKLEITRERVLKELASIGFAKATDFLTIQGGRVLIKDSDDVAADKLAALASVKEGMYGVEVKLADKARALEMLGKYLGLFDGTNPEGDTQKNNLFEAIAGAAEGGIDLNEIPEIQSSADVDADVVEET